MKNILMIEDDRQIVELVGIHLKDIHCELIEANNGKDGIGLALKQKYDLIILDLMLPDMGGVEVCKHLRLNKVNTPIMMLTARSEEIDKVIGLESGADDYMTKPFGIREFIARIKAILRRTELQTEQQIESAEIIMRGDISIDTQKRRVDKNGNKIELTPKEFDLLLLLMNHPGRSYTREQLLSLVWGYDFAGFEHTVNSHINRLRAKIEDDMSRPKYILTSWGIGYCFSDEI